MDNILQIEKRLNSLERACSLYKRGIIVLTIGLSLVCLLGAAAAVTTLNGDVAITGNLAVGGKVNGVDIERGEVRLGTMLPFFGKDLPKGYCWADGRTRWPAAEWVPTELAGEMVPDMNGELIGGTTSLTDLGRPWTKGVITLAVNKATSGEILFWRRGAHEPKILKTEGPDAQIASIGTLKYVEHVAFEGDNSTFPFNSPKQNPRFIQCRWIIRLE